jgi:hypothetical protein
MPGKFKAQVISDRMEQLKIFLVDGPNVDVVFLYRLPNTAESIPLKYSQQDAMFSQSTYFYKLL